MAAAAQAAREGRNARHFSTAQRMHDMGGAIDAPALSWDDDNSPIIPLTLVPGQASRRSRTDLETGWRALMASILAGALQDLGSRKPAIRADAAAWFASPDDGWPVSLRECCEVLGLRPHDVSTRALRWAGLA
jgi:hypothetical protein